MHRIEWLAADDWIACMYGDLSMYIHIILYEILDIST